MLLHVDLIHALAHGIHSQCISLVFQAFAGERGGSDGGLLDDLENFLNKRLIHGTPGNEVNRTSETSRQSNLPMPQSISA